MTTSPAEPLESTLAAEAKYAAGQILERHRPAIRNSKPFCIECDYHPGREGCPTWVFIQPIVAILAATDTRTIHDAARIARLEADLAAAEAKLAAVEELADEWDVLADYMDDPDSTADQRARSKAGVIAAAQLRAALTTQPAP